MSRQKVALVLNMPTPYRNPVFVELSRNNIYEFRVFFACHKEGDRDWILSDFSGYDAIFLKENSIKYRNRYIHFNFDIWAALKVFGPDVVITGGFNPVHLVAFTFCLMNKVPHISMTDGTLQSEKTLSLVHKIVRQVVYKHSKSFIGPSEGAFKLFESYGINREKIFKSHLCADNKYFENFKGAKKIYDVMFIGRFVEIKNPLFVLDVANKLSLKIGRKVKLLFLGAGEQRIEIEKKANRLSDRIEINMPGFIQSCDLPKWYHSSRVMLFPSIFEPWGVVANEAFAAGVPVIASPNVGCVNDLIVDGKNGCVLPLDVDEWANCVFNLLNNADLYLKLSNNCIESVSEYIFSNAANGICKAVDLALFN